MTPFAFALDLVLIVLLGTMIFFAVRLHRRLEVLRSGKQDLEGLLRELVTGTATAERNLRQLQVAAEELAPSLQKHVSGARAAREELEFLLGSADAAAERLVAQIEAAKASAPVAGRTAEPVSVSAPPLRAVPPIPPSNAMPTMTAPVAVQTASKTDDAERRTAEADLLRAIEKLR